MRDVPSFFGTGKRGKDQGESEGSMTPSFNPSSTNCLMDSCSTGVRGRPYFLTGFASPTSMLWTHFQRGGKPTLSLKAPGKVSFTTFFTRSPKVFLTTSSVALLPSFNFVEVSSHSSFISWT